MLTALYPFRVLKASAFHLPLTRSLRGTLAALGSSAIDKMKYSELQAECSRLGIRAKGNMVGLIYKASDCQVYCLTSRSYIRFFSLRLSSASVLNPPASGTLAKLSRTKPQSIPEQIPQLLPCFLQTFLPRHRHQRRHLLHYPRIHPQVLRLFRDSWQALLLTLLSNEPLVMLKF